MLLGFQLWASTIVFWEFGGTSRNPVGFRVWALGFTHCSSKVSPGLPKAPGPGQENSGNPTIDGQNPA